MRGLTLRVPPAPTPRRNSRLLRRLARAPFIPSWWRAGRNSAQGRGGAGGPSPSQSELPGPAPNLGVGRERGRRREGKGVHRTSPPLAGLPPQPPSPAWARDATAEVRLGPPYSVGYRVGGGARGFLPGTPPSGGTGTGELGREPSSGRRNGGDPGEGSPGHASFTLLTSLARVKGWV